MIVTIGAALLMVSNFTYYSFKDLGGAKRVPFFVMLMLVMVFVFTSLDPPGVLFSGFIVYAVSGPAFELIRWIRRRKRRAEPPKQN